MSSLNHGLIRCRFRRVQRETGAGREAAARRRSMTAGPQQRASLQRKRGASTRSTDRRVRQSSRCIRTLPAALRSSQSMPTCREGGVVAARADIVHMAKST